MGDRTENVRAYANLGNDYFFLRDFKAATDRTPPAISIYRKGFGK